MLLISFNKSVSITENPREGVQKLKGRTNPIFHLQEEPPPYRGT